MESGAMEPTWRTRDGTTANGSTGHGLLEVTSGGCEESGRLPTVTSQRGQGGPEGRCRRARLGSVEYRHQRAEVSDHQDRSLTRRLYRHSAYDLSNEPPHRPSHFPSSCGTCALHEWPSSRR